MRLAASQTVLRCQKLDVHGRLDVPLDALEQKIWVAVTQTMMISTDLLTKPWICVSQIHLLVVTSGLTVQMQRGRERRQPLTCLSSFD